MRRRWIGLGLLRAAERFRRIKRHGELGVLVTALGAAKATERAACGIAAPVGGTARATNWLRIDPPKGGRYVDIPLCAVN
jgi:hypothetical protein